MYQLHYVICNSGDGSNHIEWYDGRYISLDDLTELEEKDLERYSSGDGIQISSLNFDNYEELERFIANNPQLYVSKELDE